MTLLAGVRLGPYEITGAIGAGGMGEVFRARDTKLNRDFAIKVFQSPLSAPLFNLDEYSVSPDGRRFLFIRPRPSAGRTPITVVVNWAANLGAN